MRIPRWNALFISRTTSPPRIARGTADCADRAAGSQARRRRHRSSVPALRWPV